MNPATETPASGSSARRGPLDPRLLRHARTSRTGIATMALLGAGQAAATLTVAVALARIVTGRDALAPLAAAFVLRAALTWAEQSVAQRTAAAVTDELRRTGLAAALRHGPAWVARYGSGRLAAVLTGGLDALRPWFAGYLPALILGVTLPPLVIAAMAVVDPASALIALVTLPLIPVLGALIGWATQQRARQAWAADARLAGHFLDVVQGLATLRVYGRAERQTTVIREMTEKHRTATVRVLRVAFLSSTALDLVATLSVGLIAVEAGLRVAGGSLGLGPALLVILLAPEAYRPLREMAARYHASADATAVITDVSELLDPPAATATPEQRATSPEPPPTGGLPANLDPPATGRVVPVPTEAGRLVSHLDPPATAREEPGSAAMLVPAQAVLAADRQGRFGGGQTRPAVFASRLRVRHPGATVDALALAGLAVREGEVVALRGPSGAGKTTALRVLAGLQPADAGRVELSGPGLLYLPQRPTLPHIRKVSDAFPDVDAEAMHTALRTVGLDDEVTPETGIGEHGGGVSSGQRQRLALAALLRTARKAPAVLLLDEPTAHLDAEAEALVIAQIREAARHGCAVLVVAHRPGLLAAADRIIDVIPPKPDRALPPTQPALRPDSASPPTRSAPKPDPATSTAWPAPAIIATPQPSTSGSATARVAAWATRRPGTAVGFGAASWLAGILLTGAAAWLLVRASARPPVLTLSTAVVLVRGSAVARPLLRYLERLVSHEVAFARLGEWRARVFAGLIPRVPGPRQHRRGDLLTRIADDVDTRVDGLLRGRLPAFAAAVTVTVIAVAAVAVLPAVALPLSAGLLISAVLAPALAARQAGRLEAATGQARAESRDAVVETIDGLEELAVPAPGTKPPAAGAEPSMMGAEPGENAALAVPQRRSRVLAQLEARAARSAGAAAALGHLGWGVAVVATAFVASRSGLSPEWAAVLLLSVVALGEPVAALTDAAVARRRAASAESRLSVRSGPLPGATPTPSRPVHDPDTERRSPIPGATIDNDPVRPLPHRPRPSPIAHPRGDIVVRGLVAGWDPARPPALRGVDLELPTGSRVAVLGPSGGGKSTLAAVLAGLLAPRAGTVTGLGRAVLVGDATDHVFATTVRENLRLARPDAADPELRAVLARVRLDGWLAGLPRGLDTWLGAGGSTISGGQRRRLATARALLADPGLLILDEPTEGLDEAGAQELMADLLAATEGRTVLLLTHRTEGLDQMDARFELRGGVQSRCGTSVRGVLTSSG